MSQLLARGTRLRVQGEVWFIEDVANPGFVLYVGDAEGALEFIEQKELQP